MLIVRIDATVVSIDVVVILSPVLVEDFLILRTLLEVLRVLIVDQVLKVVVGRAPGHHLRLLLHVVIVLVIRLQEAVFFHDQTRLLARRNG